MKQASVILPNANFTNVSARVTLASLPQTRSCASLTPLSPQLWTPALAADVLAALGARPDVVSALLEAAGGPRRDCLSAAALRVLLSASASRVRNLPPTIAACVVDAKWRDKRTRRVRAAQMLQLSRVVADARRLALHQQHMACSRLMRLMSRSCSPTWR